MHDLIDEQLTDVHFSMSMRYKVWVARRPEALILHTKGPDIFMEVL